MYGQSEGFYLTDLSAQPLLLSGTESGQNDPFYSSVVWVYIHGGSLPVGVNCLNSFEGLEF